MTIDREVAAYHEAGHAVVAWAFGLTIDKITIEQEGDAAGHVIHDYGGDINEIVYGDDEMRRQVALERVAITSLAGEVAQRRFRPTSVDEQHGGSDRLSVHHALDHLADESDQALRDAWWRLLELRTERLIERHWHNVEWLVKVLLEKITLTGAEIAEVIVDAELPIEHRGKRLSFEDRLRLLAGKDAA